MRGRRDDGLDNGFEERYPRRTGLGDESHSDHGLDDLDDLDMEFYEDWLERRKSGRAAFSWPEDPF